MTSHIEPLHDTKEIQQALQVLLQEYPVEDQAVYLRAFHRFLPDPTAQRLLILKERSARGTGYLLAEIQAGGVAGVWPIRGSGASVALLNQLLHDLKARGIVMAQAVLAPRNQQDQQTLESAGFRRLAELKILAIEALDYPTSATKTDWQWRSSSPQDPELIQLIEATYHGSRDCPEVDGWRSLPDIIASYANTGQFWAPGWNIVWQGSQPLGCAIVAEHPEQRQQELVYFGVHPAVRGQGWGSKILHQILWQANQAQSEAMILSVDAANSPALRIYQAAGFRELERRLLFARRVI